MLQNTFIHLLTAYCDDEEYIANCWKEIENLYTDSSRHYHTLEHLQHMLLELEDSLQELTNKDALLFSIFYHDSIYDARRNDNEHQSALLLQKHLNNTRFNDIIHCMQQIDETKMHLTSIHTDTNLLLDLDLSVLGAERYKYEIYSHAIRKEYNMYPDLLYRKGRKKVVLKMLDNEYIYKTAFFSNRYENQARINLKEELIQLNKKTKFFGFS